VNPLEPGLMVLVRLAGLFGVHWLGMPKALLHAGWGFALYASLASFRGKKNLETGPRGPALYG